MFICWVIGRLRDLQMSFPEPKKITGSGDENQPKKNGARKQAILRAPFSHQLANHGSAAKILANWTQTLNLNRVEHYWSSKHKFNHFFLFSGVPSNIRLADVRKDLTNIDHVRSVHNVHVWALTAGKTVLSAHVVIGMCHGGSSNCDQDSKCVQRSHWHLRWRSIDRIQR